ncbi:hypothetical protein ACRROX_005156, partial [Escherichia coli]
VLPDLRRVAASVNIRIIPPHKPDSTANTASPNCPLPYFLLTRNLSLSSLITIFLLTKFMVKVAYDMQQMYNIFFAKKINNSDRQKHRITAGDIMAWLKVL